MRKTTSFTPPTAPPGFCSPGWVYNATLQKTHQMNCKRRTCPDCGKFWAYKWRSALAEKADFDKSFGLPAPTRALTLTFACNPGHEKVKAALRYFWQLVRKEFSDVQYFGAVEFNQRHTVPHIHFLLANEDYMAWDWLQDCWQTAQTWAGIGKIAFNVRIEKIRKNAQAYYTKYISKLTGGKDEIPRRENWQGRFIRYSRKFFPATIPAMAEYARFRRKLEANDQLDRLYYHVRKPLAGLSGAMEQFDREAARLDYLVNRPWSPATDRARAAPLDPPGQKQMEFDNKMTAPRPGQAIGSPPRPGFEPCLLTRAIIRATLVK